ncbi:hypothetical protein ONZ45_g17696 [Pleurotus djamor]|nr:hypothetical protein ONZ45_g17696 [Pleurotus djamor]
MPFSLAAYPFSPYLVDGLGRRAGILFGATLMIAATIIQTASHSVGMFIGARFLIGFGLTFAASAAPLLVSEVAFPSQRAQATSMYNTLWYLGSIMEEQALKILAYYHASGNENDPLVEYEFEEIKSAIALDREVANNVGWLSLVKVPGNRKRLRIILALAFFSQWSGNGLVSYYLNKVFIAIGIEDPTTQLLINGILNIYNFFVAIIAGLLCDRVGRRRLFMISTIGMVVFWTLQTICFALYAEHGLTKAGHAVIAMIFLYYGFYDLAFTPLIVSYTVEILPYSIRAKGFTVFNFCVSISLIFNQYVNPVALENIGWKYYLVYVFWLTFEAAFCYIFLIETKNRTLEETAALFDGEDAVAKLAEKGAEGAIIAEKREDIEKASSEGHA